jgi:hypothetical protein
MNDGGRALDRRVEAIVVHRREVAEGERLARRAGLRLRTHDAAMRNAHRGHPPAQGASDEAVGTGDDHGSRIPDSRIRAWRSNAYSHRQPFLL